MTAEEYLALLKERLAGNFDVEAARPLAGAVYPLYARSRVVAGRYFLHRSITYERIEINEHVLCRVLPGPATMDQVCSFVDELKGLPGRLVRPTYEHMSSAITGVLISESGFEPPAVGKLTRSGFTKHFWLGLRGWCFLRLLGVDLATGQIWANRRGKEVINGYVPGQGPRQ